MIGMFDSGVGGLSVLREALKLLPSESYAYYSDNAHCPYGEKTPEYVTARARFITEFLIGKGAEIIVIACNTATSAAISTLRKEFSDASDPIVRERVFSLTDGRQDHLLFLGMEPAVKMAVALTRSGVVGVLATAGTLRGSRYLGSRKLYSSKAKIVERVGKGFVEMVETRNVDENVIAESLCPLLDAGADTIVLGCTHYPFLLEPLKRVAERVCPDREITFIDPALNIARHLVDLMIAEGLLPNKRPSDEDNSLHSPKTAAENHTAISKSPAEQLSESMATEQQQIFSSPKVELYASGDDSALKALYSSIVRGEI